MIAYTPIRGDRPLWEEAAILIVTQVGFLIIAYILGWVSAQTWYKYRKEQR